MFLQDAMDAGYFSPLFEDSEPIYTENELSALNQPKYPYRGKDITECEAVQRQHYHERQIRRWKREKEAMKASGQPTDRSEARLRKWNRIQDDFLEQTGLKRQVDLEQIAKNVEKQASDAEKTFEKIAGRSTIKSIDVEDFEISASANGIRPEVVNVMTETIKSFERNGDMYISEAVFGDFFDEESGKPALFQIFMDAVGLVKINVNSAIFKGRA